MRRIFFILVIGLIFTAGIYKLMSWGETTQSDFSAVLVAAKNGDAEARANLVTAAENGDAEAQFNLGRLNRNHLNISSNPEAVIWFRKAAEQGHTQAMFALAEMYNSGDTVPQNDAEAVTWFRKAAEQGYAHAQQNLGWKYAQGSGVPQNDAEAYFWLSVGAINATESERDYFEQERDLSGRRLTVEVQNEVHERANAWRPSSSFDTGIKQKTPDVTRDVEALRVAAELGNAQSMFDLGMMYVQGSGVPQNDADAVTWYRKAAEQGHTQAMFALGIMYAQGLGVHQNDTEALDWLQKAAELGNAQAMFNLAEMYGTGHGVREDDAEALVWLHKAAELSYAQAMFSLGMMYTQGSGVPQNDADAVSWLHKAAEQGHTQAMLALGVMYAHGRGVRQNDAEAYFWLNLGASKATGKDRAILEEERNSVSELLTAEARNEVQARASAWRPASSTETGTAP